MKSFLYVIILVLSFSLSAQEWTESEIRINELISGTLLEPITKTDTLAIIIAGSGPTDRNGNQQMQQNNSLKKLAEALTLEGIATYRYDKRILKLLRNNTLKEENLRFEDFVDDAESVVRYFKNRNFKHIVLIGHSQGALVASLTAANEPVDMLVSLAGSGQPLDLLILDQLAKQAPGLVENAKQAFEDLKNKGKAENFSIGLASLLRPSVQPFMKSWMLYDPALVIQNLEIPILLVSGSKDIQVPPSESQLLKDAKPEAKLVFIDSMNHVLKEVNGDDLDNAKTYSNPSLPVIKKLIVEITSFIREGQK
ncbi:MULTISPECIES: alpha/beta hydrolase [unclassified Leeuwenhoekiella]|uniref:alpha/beta hydrolase n=1 Tax=unclassified Leeuwenhoekiella TaxID=2615029 RepID=UPI000C58823F|nr:MULTISPECIES: alpha/beta hydrolase [unclassified Leeuwenhoekiella]MAW97152.1 alpha/beta hydrolase [Leeuwenhoekiella sp.]MBA82668.1 alpha/beta hydrolase [Leeuwenhoekiella sp.]|tara:strand:+ start:44512 stop:45441 length:930 start_codon:yes stop_codon:yes gene_type:complete